MRPMGRFCRSSEAFKYRPWAAFAAIVRTLYELTKLDDESFNAASGRMLPGRKSLISY
jgi:hypothetical protein